MTRTATELGYEVAGEGAARVHRLRYRVPEGFLFFEGHFRGEPVLPGAVELDRLVLPAVERALPELGPLRRAVRIKFSRPVRPGDELEVALSHEGGGRVRFRVRRGDVQVASGVLELEVG